VEQEHPHPGNQAKALVKKRASLFVLELTHRRVRKVTHQYHVPVKNNPCRLGIVAFQR